MENEIKTKVCSKCGEEKPLTKEYFFSRKDSKDGFRNDCKICNCNKRKKHYSENVESEKLRRSEWYKNNKELHKKSMNLFYENNPNYQYEYGVKYREKNKEVLYERKKEYSKNNREKFNFWNRKYYSQNKEKRMVFVKDYKRKKYNSDSFYKLKINLRNATNRFINVKKTSTENILGCDYETFKKHIEKQFLIGMNWENHNSKGWHLDHIIPLASAKNEDEVIKLNHYTNFQPLWAEDNLRKSDKIAEEWGNA